MKRSTLLSVVLLGSLSLSGLISCKKSETAGPGKPWEGDPSKPITVGKFTIIETLIDLVNSAINLIEVFIDLGESLLHIDSQFGNGIGRDISLFFDS